MAGDEQGGVGSQVVLDQGQGQVDAGGDPGGGGEGAVAHEDGVGVDGDVGEAAGQGGAVVPVGGGAPAVEEAGLGEDERAGADRGDAAGMGCAFGDPGHQARVGGSGSGSAGDDEGVDGADPVQGGVGEQGQSAVGAYGGAVGGGGDHAWGAVGVARDRGGAVEDLQGAGDVEALDPVEEREEHGGTVHVSIVGHRSCVRNDEVPTFPAIRPVWTIGSGPGRPATSRTRRGRIVTRGRRRSTS